MIKVLLKNKELLKAKSLNEIQTSNLEFLAMQFIDYEISDINWLEKKYSLDFSIMNNFEDIEISSHFLENDHQASFHFSIPYYNSDQQIIEEPIFIIFSEVGLFFFYSSNLNDYFNKIYPNKILMLQKKSDIKSIFKFHVEFISDYFADITENLSKKIKSLAKKVLIEKEFTNTEMDIITTYNFNNLIIKESLIEVSRVLTLYIKSNWDQKVDLKKNIKTELNDLHVISDYIQFNFDRLDDLKENISSKIDLEQNHIFKLLTIVTVCISLPTLIAGIYGMNFDKIPELKTSYGYPIVIILMILSAILPFIYFKRKKWIK